MRNYITIVKWVLGVLGIVILGTMAVLSYLYLQELFSVSSTIEDVRTNQRALKDYQERMYESFSNVMDRRIDELENKIDEFDEKIKVWNQYIEKRKKELAVTDDEITSLDEAIEILRRREGNADN